MGLGVPDHFWFGWLGIFAVQLRRAVFYGIYFLGGILAHRGGYLEQRRPSLPGWGLGTLFFTGGLLVLTGTLGLSTAVSLLIAAGSKLGR